MIGVSKLLSEWYNQNKRDLPWRNTKDPYTIWVSEVILQQTRVNQGINYYYRFIEQYPNIKRLANASIDEVLKLWQGLGYYSRARNMHQTAKIIVSDYNGTFPDQYSELLKLKGIGEYTAAAIASFCFDEPIPVIDGNVYRFLARYFGSSESTQSSKGKKYFKEKAQEIIDSSNPGEHNQAIMEFGALQCTPKSPNCSTCPFNDSCFALGNSLVKELPVIKTKTKISKRYFNYIYIIYRQNFFIEQRNNNDIWQLLYQLPLIETKNLTKKEDILKHELWEKIFDNSNVKIIHSSKNYLHKLSHQIINARFFCVQIDNPSNYLINNYITASKSDFSKYSIPRLIEKYFDDILL